MSEEEKKKDEKILEENELDMVEDVVETESEEKSNDDVEKVKEEGDTVKDSFIEEDVKENNVEDKNEEIKEIEGMSDESSAAALVSSDKGEGSNEISDPKTIKIHRDTFWKYVKIAAVVLVLILVFSYFR